MKFLQLVLRILPGKTLRWRLFDGSICLILLAFTTYYVFLSLRQAEPWYQIFLLGDAPETPGMQYSNAVFGIGMQCLLVLFAYCFLRRYARYTTCITIIGALILIWLNATHLPPAPPPLTAEQEPWDVSWVQPDNGLTANLLWLFLLPTLSSAIQWMGRWLARQTDEMKRKDKSNRAQHRDPQGRVE